MTHFPEFFRCSTCLPRSNLDPGKFRERLKLDRLGRIEIGENCHFQVISPILICCDFSDLCADWVHKINFVVTYLAFTLLCRNLSKQACFAVIYQSRRLILQVVSSESKGDNKRMKQ